MQQGKSRIFVTIAALALAAGIAQARSAPDKGFVEKAAKDGTVEMAVAKLAATRASSPEVKQLAQQLMSDHQKVNAELHRIAQSKGIRLDEKKMAREASHETKQLARLEGQKFDRSFVKQVVKDHQKDIKAFDHEAKNGKDPQVKEWAGTTLASLQQHLQMAKDAEAKL